MQAVARTTVAWASVAWLVLLALGPVSAAEKATGKAEPKAVSAEKAKPAETAAETDKLVPAKSEKSARADVGETTAEAGPSAPVGDKTDEKKGATTSSHAAAKGAGNVPVIYSIYILMLAGFVGFEVIGRVSPLLHTPLMSATNAISGISLVGSLVAAGSGELGTVSHVLGFIAVTAATINVVGGFMITDRMLKMFKLRGKQQHG